MLTVCIKYGADFEVRFNPAKTVYVLVHTIVEIRN